MTLNIVGLAFAYAFVVAIMVGLFAARRVAPFWRVGAALAAVGLFFATYLGIGELRGLPSDAEPPEFFKLHWARVVEPNPLTGDEGRVFLWLEALDEDNYPSGVPRAYVLPFSTELVRKVDSALANIQDGQDVAGTIEGEGEGDDTAERLALELEMQQGQQDNSGTIGERVHKVEFGDLSFVPLPSPVTPEKPL